MKTTDFTLSWVQKFDYNGKPYVFDKIDVSLGTRILGTTLGKYNSYTSEQQKNVMIVLSDDIFSLSSSGSTTARVFESGEVIYLSTLLSYLSFNEQFYFALERKAIEGQFGTFYNKSLLTGFFKMAGTFYIFDFNDNPV